MLRLEKMLIVGFKSFGDRTEVEFPEGITAVVGPNGCGKSNIGDALNWVLGEQSAKMLRGSSMEDVIFNGTEGRKPMGMAEVSLHLAGDNGVPDRREVVLTRRLFRDGESEYLINGQRARLKDIQEVLRDAHVGAKTYATIEQGRIDQILNAKAKERRLIIEDAAGISGFKQKRRLTELKLDATQANLLRVNDIVTEVRRQIGALKRQAAKARRYKRLRDELRSKESVRFGLKARDLDLDLARLVREEGLRREAEVLSAARLGAQEAEMARERQAIEEAGLLLFEARELLHKVERQVSEEETCIRSCRERMKEGEEVAGRLEAEAAGLAARTVALEEEGRAQMEQEDLGRSELAAFEETLAQRLAAWESARVALQSVREELESLRRGLFESMNVAAEARNQRRALEEAIERSSALRARRTAERTAAHGEVTRFEAETRGLVEEERSQREALEERERAHRGAAEALAVVRVSLATGVADLAAAREKEQSAAARLRTLEDVATRFAGVSDGVRVLLTAGASAGVRHQGVVADYVEAGAEIEAAAEAYLQALLPAVVLEDDQDAQGAAALLRTQGAGRTSFLCRSHPIGVPAVGSAPDGQAGFPREILEDPRVIGRLRDRLEIKANGFLHGRIGDAILVESLESALALHRAYPAADYLTTTGEVVYASGLVSAGGKQQADHGMLAHARKIHHARAEHAEAAASVSACQARADSVRAETARLESAVAERGHGLEDARRRLVELDLRLERSTEEARRTGRATEVLAEEIRALEEEALALGADLDRSRGQVAEAERMHADNEAALRTRASAAEDTEGILRSLSEETSVLRAEVAVRRQTLANAERDRLRRQGESADLGARIAAMAEEAVLARRRAREAGDVLVTSEASLLDHLRRRDEQVARVAFDETSLGDRRAELDRREGSLRELRAELEAAREGVRTAELARARAESDRLHLDDLCAQELSCTAAEAAASAGDALDTADPAAISAEIEEVRAAIERVGPVNMMAIEEFTELEQRYSFLTSQQKDLEDAMISLRETIRRINAVSREQFQNAFEAIRTSYQEIFRVLFGGGRADLRLEEGEDVLECGVEILAQPPGKRLGSVQLLSGGEKAMAAIALLFAIFRYQPSPFCLLDEVDAALDDVNVNRFTRMLREYSGTTQFILITHSKVSMESANLLYGVTMEEAGVSRIVSLKLE